MNELDDKLLSPQHLNITNYCLKYHADHHPKKIALIVVDQLGMDRSFSYETLYQRVCQLAQGLKTFHLKKGTRVGIQAYDSLDLLLLFLAAIGTDLVPVPFLFSLTRFETKYILENSNAALFFQIGKIDVPDGLPCQSIHEDDYRKLFDFPYKDLRPTTLFHDPAFIFYTSGSSGNPKGVLHAQRTILGRKPSLIHWLHLNAHDIVLQTDNLCWTYCMFSGFLDPLAVGATALVYNPSNQSSLAEDKVTGDLWMEIIRHYHVSVVASTPDIFNTLIHARNQAAPSLRMAGSAGTSLSNETQKAWESMFHFPIFTALGMSELSTFISTGEFTPYRENTIGKIQPGRKVAILPIKEGLLPVDIHTLGMLAIHREELGFMLGYINQNEDDLKKFRGDWFLTEDLVSEDESGYLHYYGRADTIIKVSGGFRVSPIEIEMEIKRFEAIKDVACSSIYDEASKTDMLIAYLVTPTPSTQYAERLINYLTSQLSDYKIPIYYYFVKALPYTERNKLMRKELNKLSPLLVYTYQK